MKSVGEAMWIGRTFNEAFGKAMRSRELDIAPRDRRARRRAALGSLRHAARTPARGRGPRGAGGREPRAPLVPARARAHGRTSRTELVAAGLGRIDAGAVAAGEARTASATRGSRSGSARDEDDVRGRRASRSACDPSSRRSTPAPPRSRRARATATRRYDRRATSRSTTTGRRADPRLRARTASARASSSTTAASTPSQTSARSATRRSW